MKKYEDNEVNNFLELAQEVGITKAMRELGYPSSWSTAQYWAKKRGITVAVDDLKAQAAATREWYKEEEVKTLIQEGFNRVHAELMSNKDLSADDQKKLSEAASKYYNMWANIMGKTLNAPQSMETGPFSDHLDELLAMQRAKNLLKGEQPVSQ